MMSLERDDALEAYPKQAGQLGEIILEGRQKPRFPMSLGLNLDMVSAAVFKACVLELWLDLVSLLIF